MSETNKTSTALDAITGGGDLFTFGQPIQGGFIGGSMDRRALRYHRALLTNRCLCGALLKLGRFWALPLAHGPRNSRWQQW